MRDPFRDYVFFSMGTGRGYFRVGLRIAKRLGQGQRQEQGQGQVRGQEWGLTQQDAKQGRIQQAACEIGKSNKHHAASVAEVQRRAELP